MREIRLFLPLWRFRTPELARESSAAILRRFRAYGRKYFAGGKRLRPRAPDPVKAESAAIFHQAWRAAVADRTYQALMRRHRERHEAAR